MRFGILLKLGICALLFSFQKAGGQGDSEKELSRRMTTSAKAFVSTLTEVQKQETLLDFEDQARFDWNYTPRNRKGGTFKTMNQLQRKHAMDLVKTVLSAEGYLKAEQIIDLENVLRALESRPANDTYRDPENYAFLFFGEPGAKVWGWRFEGHHLSLHFSSVDGKIAFLPGFMGSNPASVKIDVPQKGRQVLKEEVEQAFLLLNSFSEAQLVKVMLEGKAPHEIFTTNSRKALLEKKEGLAFGEMSDSQKAQFRKLIGIYLGRYHITLKNKQWAQLEERGLDEIFFAWMGDTKLEFGTGLGHYYRIHGPGFLIEFDNTQNQGNHIHSVVRDLDNDFGEDLLRLHYEKQHR